MKRHVGISIVLVLIAVSIDASSGGRKKVMGTISKMETNAMSIRSTDGHDVSVELTPKTRFVMGEEPASIKDANVGRRVILYRAPDGTADEVRLGVVTVREVLIKNASAFATGDLRTLEEIWAHDATVTVFENGHANYGWDDYRDHHLKPEIAEMKNVKYELGDIATHVSGDIAWSTFKYSIAADLTDRHVEGAGLGTAVLELRSGSWKIVHWHTSAPRTKANAAPAK
jgi:ketosteroid isomerase-like protein